MNKKAKMRGGIDSLFTAPKINTEPEDIQPTDATATAIRAFKEVGGVRRGRPARHTENRPATEKGCKQGEARVTLIMNKEQTEALKNIAYWQRMDFKAVIADAAAQFIKAYEKKNGTVKPRK